MYQTPHKVVCQQGDCMATLIFLRGFVWVFIASYTHFVILEGGIFQ